MKNHAILICSITIKDTRKKITPHETRQNLLLKASILVTAKYANCSLFFRKDDRRATVVCKFDYAE